MCDRQLALVIDKSETEIFTQNNWTTLTVAEALKDPETFHAKHLAT